MKQLSQMLQQAQQMQAKLEVVQKELDAFEVDGYAASSLITATVSGKGILRRLKIDPSIVDPADVEMLEDLIIVAINDARSKADAHAALEMNKASGGMKMPGGLKFPV
jgi:hypothetical protein